MKRTGIVLFLLFLVSFAYGIENKTGGVNPRTKIYIDAQDATEIAARIAGDLVNYNLISSTNVFLKNLLDSTSNYLDNKVNTTNVSSGVILGLLDGTSNYLNTRINVTDVSSGVILGLLDGTSNYLLQLNAATNVSTGVIVALNEGTSNYFANTKLSLTGGTITGIIYSNYSWLGSSSVYINEIFTTNNIRVGGELNISGGGATALRIGGQGSLGISGSRLRVNGVEIYFTPNDSATELMRLKSTGKLEISSITALSGSANASVFIDTVTMVGAFYPQWKAALPETGYNIGAVIQLSTDDFMLYIATESVVGVWSWRKQ